MEAGQHSSHSTRHSTWSCRGLCKNLVLRFHERLTQTQSSATKMMMKMRNLFYNRGQENLFLLKFGKQKLRENMITRCKYNFFTDSWGWCWNKNKRVETGHECFLTIRRVPNHHSTRFWTRFPVGLAGVSICMCICDSTRGKKNHFVSRWDLIPFSRDLDLLLYRKVPCCPLFLCTWHGHHSKNKTMASAMLLYSMPLNASKWK